MRTRKSYAVPGFSPETFCVMAPDIVPLVTSVQLLAPATLRSSVQPLPKLSIGTVNFTASVVRCWVAEPAGATEVIATAAGTAGNVTLFAAELFQPLAFVAITRYCQVLPPA